MSACLFEQDFARIAGSEKNPRLRIVLPATLISWLIKYLYAN